MRLRPEAEGDDAKERNHKGQCQEQNQRRIERDLACPRRRQHLHDRCLFITGSRTSSKGSRETRSSACRWPCGFPSTIASRSESEPPCSAPKKATPCAVHR